MRTDTYYPKVGLLQLGTPRANFLIDPLAISDVSPIVALLEDLLAAAVNDAVRRVEAQHKEKMSELTGGLQMPPGFKFPFQA